MRKTTELVLAVTGCAALIVAAAIVGPWYAGLPALAALGAILFRHAADRRSERADRSGP